MKSKVSGSHRVHKGIAGALIFKHEILKQLSSATNLKESFLEPLLETPPEPHLGDFAFPCFSLAKKYKQPPNDIASSLIPKLKANQLIEEIEQKGPYINFFINKAKLASLVINEILKKSSGYGKSHNKKQRILIEYPSPNTNKPLHLGHIRNILLGSSLNSLLKFQGNNVYQVSLNNDRGIHICKSMLAYNIYGFNQKPDKKPDHFVGDFYVKFNQAAIQNPDLEQQAQEMLSKWEQKNPAILALWKKMNSWALQGFQETYKKFNLSFTKQYYESKFYDKGKDIILKALKKGLFTKDEKGNIIASLPELGNKVVLRADSTSVYITQDIYLAYLKNKEFHPDKSIYIVASEQDYHFKALFKILTTLGFKTNNLYHLSYGMVYLPEGKMKSREGKVIDADDLIDEVTQLARNVIEEKHPKLSNKELDKRAKIIGMAALKFFILKQDPKRDFTYNPEESLSFEGETGPYIQYTYARIKSILRKAKPIKQPDLSYLSQAIEKQLITLLQKYPQILAEATEKYKISLLASYLIELSKTFNSFYHEHPVLKAEHKEVRAARLHLIKAISIVLSSALAILGIEALEEM